MEYIWIAVILFAAGALLVAAELVLPGGVLGAFGALAIIGGVVLCFFHSQSAGAISLLAITFVGPSLGYLWVKNAHRLPGSRSLFLADTADASTGTPIFHLQPGQIGVAVSELKPGGTCEFDGQRVPSQSEAGIISAGASVRLVAFADGRATVRAA